MNSPRDTLVEPIAVELAFRTDPGRDPEKQVNEDAGFHKVTRFGTLCVVCDGMGGHANGQDASAAAIKAIEETFDTGVSGVSGRDLLREGVTLGHTRIRELPLAAGEARAGSTVVAILLTPLGAEVAHVGDSRVLFISRGRIQQVTRDHSMVQLMVDAGMIKQEEAATHPDANKIMRALGIATDVQVEVRPEPIPFSPGDVFVLASDGLTDLVTDAEIFATAGPLPLEQAAGQLVDLANARGGHDNITVLLARLREASTTEAIAGGGVGATLVSGAVANTQPDPPDEPRAGATVLAAPLPMPAGPGAAPGATVATAVVVPAAPTAAVAPVAPTAAAAIATSGVTVTPAALVPPGPPRSTRTEPKRGRPWLVAFLVLVAVVALVVVAAGLYRVLVKSRRVEPQIAVPLSALPRVAESAPSAEPEPTAAPSIPEETPPLVAPSAPRRQRATPSAIPSGE